MRADKSTKNKLCFLLSLNLTKSITGEKLMRAFQKQNESSLTSGGW